MTLIPAFAQVIISFATFMTLLVVVNYCFVITIFPAILALVQRRTGPVEARIVRFFCGFCSCSCGWPVRARGLAWQSQIGDIQSESTTHRIDDNPSTGTTRRASLDSVLTHPQISAAAEESADFFPLDEINRGAVDDGFGVQSTANPAAQCHLHKQLSNRLASIVPARTGDWTGDFLIEHMMARDYCAQERNSFTKLCIQFVSKPVWKYYFQNAYFIINKTLLLSS